MNNKIVKELLNNGESWSNIWLKFDQIMYLYDDNFKSIKHGISKRK